MVWFSNGWDYMITGPFEIRPSKSPDFKCFQISDPAVSINFHNNQLSCSAILKFFIFDVSFLKKLFDQLSIMSVLYCIVCFHFHISCINIIQWGSKYSNHPNTGHPKSGFIRNPDFLVFGIQMVRYSDARYFSKTPVFES